MTQDEPLWHIITHGGVVYSVPRSQVDLHNDIVEVADARTGDVTHEYGGLTITATIRADAPQVGR